MKEVRLDCYSYGVQAHTTFFGQSNVIAGLFVCIQSPVCVRVCVVCACACVHACVHVHGCVCKLCLCMCVCRMCVCIALIRPNH